MMKTRILITVLTCILGATVTAQENPNNFHARHNGESVYNVDRSQQAPQQRPPQPTGYWEKTWGAIAPSPVGGVLGTALGASSKEEAERLALQDCKQKGGGACEVRLAYYNQCAVMVLGSKIYRTASAGSIQEASDLGVGACSQEDSNCRVYYSACTEPIFHRY